jgi:hypothetical protein
MSTPLTQSVQATSLYADVVSLETTVAKAVESFHAAQPEFAVEELLLLRQPHGQSPKVHAHIVCRHESLPNPADQAVS